MDEVGAMSAMRHAGASCVTAHIDQLNFKRPIPQGDICVIDAYVYAVGESSLRVHLQAYREDPRTGEREQTTDSYFVFVALDEDMNPTSVPELTVETERGERLREEALDGETRE
jgi:acyl-CoA hydrolase